MAVKIIEVHAPEYNLNTKPDYLKIGRKVDRIIEKSFPNGKYIIRAIGSQDHPKISLNKLAEIILKTGTDKYDLKRKEVCFEEFCEYDYDIQAGSFEIKHAHLLPNKDDKYPSIFGDIIYNFYENTIKDRGYSVRIDLLLIYNLDKLVKAKKIDFCIKRGRKGWDMHLYKFKYPKHKKDALIGIVKILR